MQKWMKEKQMDERETDRPFSIVVDESAGSLPH
jgi:hypothetical protein